MNTTESMAVEESKLAQSEPPKPSIGRIVHFIAEVDQTHLAAIVTAVNDDGTVNLTVFGGNGGYGFSFNVSEGEEAGTWHWPERV